MNKKTVHKHYRQTKNNNTDLSMEILEKMIDASDSVRLLSQIMEELNYEELIKAYSPKILFKILVYAYMNDIHSTRKIEKACFHDINFMWLLQGLKVPDHNTIARFISKRISIAGENLFYQLINKLIELKEIELENVFID